MLLYPTYVFLTLLLKSWLMSDVVRLLLGTLVMAVPSSGSLAPNGPGTPVPLAADARHLQGAWAHEIGPGTSKLH
jgi:hypothetical protein